MEPSPQTLTNTQLLVWGIVSIVASNAINFLITTYLYRRKPAAEIHESEARTAKIEAETDSIELRSNMSAAELVSTMTRQAVESQIMIGQLNAKLMHKDDQIRLLEDQVEKFSAERTLERVTKTSGEHSR